MRRIVDVALVVVLVAAVGYMLYLSRNDGSWAGVSGPSPTVTAAFTHTPTAAFAPSATRTATARPGASPTRTSTATDVPAPSQALPDALSGTPSPTAAIPATQIARLARSPAAP